MLFAGPMAANAIPIPVASGVGNGLIVNFDFTGSTLAPPYASIVTTFSLQGLGAGEQVFLDVFAGLNAAPGPNQLIVANASNGLNVDGLKAFSPLPFLPNRAGYPDGVYSFAFRINQGTAELLFQRSAMTTRRPVLTVRSPREPGC